MPLTAVQEADIVALYAAGETGRTIGAKYGISSASVTTLVRKHGGQVRSSGPTRKPQLSETDRAEIVTRYAAGESSKTIAADYGISQNTVLASADRAGVQRRARGRKGKPAFTPADQIVQAAAYAAGFSSKRIGKVEGAAPVTVRKHARMLGVSIRPQRRFPD